MKRARGFTLVELVVVVAIIGILVAIAVPSYQNHLRKARRAEAQTYLLDLANVQQQYLLDARTYAPDPATLNKPPPAGVSNFYNVAFVVPDPLVPAPSYLLTAIVRAGSPQERDGDLTLSSSGAKTRAGVAGW